MCLEFSAWRGEADFSMLHSIGRRTVVTDSNHTIGLLRSGNPQQADSRETSWLTCDKTYWACQRLW
jgi:hypothetical protein